MIGDRHEAGFTLIEVMIALLIFAMLAVAGVALLAFSVRAQAATGKRLDDIAAFNRLTSVMAADFAQATPRQTRGEGGEPQPAFLGASGSGSEPMLRLVRGGWSNVDAAPRASDQKVEYRFLDNAVLRTVYPMLDGTQPTIAAPMLDRVTGVALRYRFNGAWSDHWDGSAPAILPQAIEIRLMRPTGDVRALFLVGAGQQQAPTRGQGGLGNAG